MFFLESSEGNRTLKRLVEDLGLSSTESQAIMFDLDCLEGEYYSQISLEIKLYFLMEKNPKLNIASFYFGRIIEQLQDKIESNERILIVADGKKHLFANEIQKRYPKKRITVIDPLLEHSEEKGNLKLIKGEFLDSTPKIKKGDFDIILAHKPCKAAVEIVKFASRQGMKYSFINCGCACSAPEILKEYDTNLKRIKHIVYFEDNNSKESFKEKIDEITNC